MHCVGPNKSHTGKGRAILLVSLLAFVKPDDGRGVATYREDQKVLMLYMAHLQALQMSI